MDLRKFILTIYAASGIEFQRVKQIVGHKSDVLQEVYNRPFGDALRREDERIRDRFILRSEWICDRVF